MIQNVIVDKDITDWDVDCTSNDNYQNQYNITMKRLKEETQSLFKNFELI